MMGFFRNRRNRIIEEKINEAYKASSEFIDTNIHWEAFERFAQEHGGRTDKYADGGLDTAFNISLNTSGFSEDFLALLYQEKDETAWPGLVISSEQQDSINRQEKTGFEKLRVSGVRNRLDGTTSIQVRKA